MANHQRSPSKTSPLILIVFVSVLAMAGLIAVSGSASETDTGHNRPNILFIISDDLTVGALGCYGNQMVKTPAIDNLASAGMRFDRAYCQFPVCGAARAALMASMYSPSVGVMGNGAASRLDRNLTAAGHPAWPEYFRHRGYYTARVGKIYHMRVPGDITAGVDGPDHRASWTEKFNCRGPEWMSYGVHNHYSNHKLRFNPTAHYGLGFGTAFYAVETYTDGMEQPDAQAAQQAIRIMQAHADRHEPFFLAVGFVRPHVPLVAPSNHFETYRDAVPELPDVPEGDRDDIPSEGISLNSEALGIAGKPGRKRAVIKAYSAAVSYMDAQVQLILDALNGLELAGNTIVIFTSDHGYHLGEHDLWQKVSLHEESVRVPMIVAGPGIQPGVSSRLAAHVDLYPTIAALCGLAVPEKCQGIDISPLLKGDERSLREGVHSCTGRGHLWRTERYAYMQYRSGAEEFYDMEADPQQFNNLANSDDPDIRRIAGEHRGALERFLAGLPDYGAMAAAGPRR